MGARAIGVLLGPWSVEVAEWWLDSYTASACVRVHRSGFSIVH